MSRFFFYCFFIMISIASSCHKKKDTPPAENLGFFSLGEAKDYILFKPGSNWVYENTLTKELDSIVLIYCHLDTLHGKGEKRFFDYETINYYTESHRDNSIYATYCSGPNPDAIDFDFGWTFECNRSGGFYRNYYSDFSAAIQFYYPFDKDHGRLSLSTAQTKFVERIDSMSIRNNVYYNIVKFSVIADSSFPYPNQNIGNNSSSTYYWAKSIGIIKIEIQGWDMKDNKIYFNWELTKSLIK